MAKHDSSIEDIASYLEITVNEVIKPALERQEDSIKETKNSIKEINDKLNQDTYAKRSDIIQVKNDITDLKKITRNSPLVEKAVLTIIGVMVLFVITEVIKRSFTTGGV